jgi:hypothetical protein
MTHKSSPPGNAIPRRHFMRSASLATAALGMKPLAGLAAPAHEIPTRADAPGKLCLWSDRPAKTWMTEALPIGNGPMGAMLFGGTAIERVQFNEISLWTGDRMAVEGRMLGESDAEEEQNLGAYQAFGDILIHLGHDFSKVTDYWQELDIDRAVHQVTYAYNCVRYQRTTFASHPDGVIVIHLTSNQPAACTGRVQLADMHQARIAADGNKLSSVGKLGNGFEYEAQLLVLNQNGTVAVRNDDACAKNPWDIAVPATSLAFEDYAKNTSTDPELEALFCQFGRYLLISCSRPGSLPANLQGVWNDSNQPAWAGDYHSNINLEMNENHLRRQRRRCLSKPVRLPSAVPDRRQFRRDRRLLRDAGAKPRGCHPSAARAAQGVAARKGHRTVRTRRIRGGYVLGRRPPDPGRDPFQVRPSVPGRLR